MHKLREYKIFVNVRSTRDLLEFGVHVNSILRILASQNSVNISTNHTKQNVSDGFLALTPNFHMKDP